MAQDVEATQVGIGDVHVPDVRLAHLKDEKILLGIRHVCGHILKRYRRTKNYAIFPKVTQKVDTEVFS